MVNPRVFISPQVQQELVDLLSEKSEEQSASWFIEQLRDFLLNRLSLSPTGGVRQDAIHIGVRVQMYGFYEIYYCFDGANIYIVHVGYDRTLIQ